MTLTLPLNGSSCAAIPVLPGFNVKVRTDPKTIAATPVVSIMNAVIGNDSMFMV